MVWWCSCINFFLGICAHPSLTSRTLTDFSTPVSMQRWPGVPLGLFILLTHAQMHYGCMYLLDAVASSNISVSRSYGNGPDPRVRHIFSCKGVCLLLIQGEPSITEWRKNVNFILVIGNPKLHYCPLLNPSRGQYAQSATQCHKCQWLFVFLFLSFNYHCQLVSDS